MSAHEEPNSYQSLMSAKEKRDILMMIYKETSENARYYDSHIWQIPSVTVAINAFLIGQAFSDGLRGETWVQALVVLSASFFTFVLLIALVKHRLHKRAKDANLKIIAESEYLKVEEKFTREYQFPTDLPLLEKNPVIILKILSGMKANLWLMSVMAITVLVDLVIFIGIVCGKL